MCVCVVEDEGNLMVGVEGASGRRRREEIKPWCVALASRKSAHQAASVNTSGTFVSVIRFGSSPAERRRFVST